MHKVDLFTAGGVTAYNGAYRRQSFSAGGAKASAIPMHNSPSKSRMNDDKTIVVNKSTIKNTTMAEILRNGEALKNEEPPEAWIKVQ
ncbi:unnamed protein product [Parnassius apollo]|uniref:(apollo) hypothetical protein n=1 Tax=Parnassius apollo TaxID=110799 RepID=A0A8S3W9H2_PARAO|nr:unnamed protein product [Parnassius apollo]